MDCIRAHTILSAVAKTQAVPSDITEAEILEVVKIGLLTRIEPSVYQADNREVEAYDDYLLKQGETKKLLKMTEAEIDELERKLASGLQNFWILITKFSDAEIKAREERLKDLKQVKENTETDLALVNAKIMHAEVLIKERKISPTTEILGYYLQIDYKADDLFRQLSATIHRLSKVSLQSFLEASRLMDKTIGQRIARFWATRRELMNHELSDSDALTWLALSLSGMHGDHKVLAADAANVRKMFDQDFDGGGQKGFRSIPAFMSLPGDFDPKKEMLLKIWKIMLENEYERSYDTFYLAVQLLKVPGETAEEKFQRFDQIGDELDKRKWSKRETYSRIIAANLAALPFNGEPADLAANFRETEEALIGEGAQDSVHSGMAAMVLVRAKSTIQEKAANWKEALWAMHQHGWETRRDYYQTAAVISILPGTIDENVFWLDKIYRETKKQNISGSTKEATSFALQVLTGRYQGLIEIIKEHTKFSDGQYVYNETDSDDSFSLMELYIVWSFIDSFDDLPDHYVEAITSGDIPEGLFGGGLSDGGGAGANIDSVQDAFHAEIADIVGDNVVDFDSGGTFESVTGGLDNVASIAASDFIASESLGSIGSEE